MYGLSAEYASIHTFGLRARPDEDVDGAPCDGWHYEGSVLQACADARLPEHVEAELPDVLREALEQRSRAA